MKKSNNRSDNTPNPKTMDAVKWTDCWLKTIAKHPEIPTDRGTMLVWFANAIMRGFDAGRASNGSALQLSKATWHHVLIFARLSELEFAMPLANHMTKHGFCYFCRYTNPPGNRMELKIFTVLTERQIKKEILTYLKDARFDSPAGFKTRKFEAPTKIKFSKVQGFQGSMPHAIAMQVVIGLENEGKTSTTQYISDVAHWMYNMAGFSYLQEAEMCLRQAHMAMTGSIANWMTAPCFKNPGLYKFERFTSKLKTKT